ncbi:hypothetical protein [Clostridium sp.]|uniref:hypothetical protein n=1 Tax=Clostridia TaxID=186801 RepID=UPI003991F164
MEVKHFKDINLISKVLYVISIIILLYTLLTIYNSHVYISSLVASNRIVVSESILMVITYYINSSLPYAFYSIATFSMGYIISGLNVKKEVKKDIKSDLEDFDKLNKDLEDFDKLNKDDNELEELIEYLKD